MEIHGKKAYDKPELEKLNLWPNQDLTTLDVAEENEDDFSRARSISGWSPWV